MIHELSGRELLRGIRGALGIDLDALAHVVVAVSQLLEEQERIVEFDINPIVSVDDTGVLTALDALIILS